MSVLKQIQQKRASGGTLTTSERSFLDRAKQQVQYTTARKSAESSGISETQFRAVTGTSLPSDKNKELEIASTVPISQREKILMDIGKTGLERQIRQSQIDRQTRSKNVFGVTQFPISTDLNRDIKQQDRVTPTTSFVRNIFGVREYDKSKEDKNYVDPKLLQKQQTKPLTGLQKRAEKLVKLEEDISYRLGDRFEKLGLNYNTKKLNGKDVVTLAPSNFVKAIGRIGVGFVPSVALLGSKIALAGESTINLLLSKDKNTKKNIKKLLFSKTQLKNTKDAIVTSYNPKSPEGIINIITTGLTIGVLGKSLATKSALSKQISNAKTTNMIGKLVKGKKDYNLKIVGELKLPKTKYAGVKLKSQKIPFKQVVQGVTKNKAGNIIKKISKNTYDLPISKAGIKDIVNNLLRSKKTTKISKSGKQVKKTRTSIEKAREKISKINDKKTISAEKVTSKLKGKIRERPSSITLSKEERFIRLSSKSKQGRLVDIQQLTAKKAGKGLKLTATEIEQLYKITDPITKKDISVFKIRQLTDKIGKKQSKILLNNLNNEVKKTLGKKLTLTEKKTLNNNILKLKKAILKMSKSKKAQVQLLKQKLKTPKTKIKPTDLRKLSIGINTDNIASLLSNVYKSKLLYFPLPVKQIISKKLLPSKVNTKTISKLKDLTKTDIDKISKVITETNVKTIQDTPTKITQKTLPKIATTTTTGLATLLASNYFSNILPITTGRFIPATPKGLFAGSPSGMGGFYSIPLSRFRTKRSYRYTADLLSSELGLKQKGNLYELGKKIYTGTELRRIV